MTVLPERLARLASANPPDPPLAGAYWVIPGRFMAGPHPGGFSPLRAAMDVTRLLGVGITFFLNLTEPGEEAGYVQHLAGRARQVRLAIRDFDVPSRAEMVIILDTIDRALAQEHGVYLHCFAGLGRTGTVVGAYLVRHGLTGEDALAALKALRAATPFARSASPQTEAQVAFVRTWRG